VADMPIINANSLVNILPDEGVCRLRKGFTQYCQLTNVTLPVRSLFELPTTAGTSRLIAVVDDKIWDATTATSPSDITDGATITSDLYQAVVFRNRLLLFNGEDAPLNVPSTGDAEAQTYTGMANPDRLINPSSYKGRLYLVEKQSASVWYGGIDEFQGELKEFDFSSLFSQGGQLLWAGSFTREQGFMTTDIFLAVSNQGEVLAYVGDSPAPGGGFALVGRVSGLPKPLGYRSFINVGNDVLVMTEAGVFPISKVLAGEFITEESAISLNVNKAFKKAAKFNRDLFGWQPVFYPNERYVAFNIPISGSSFEQYVMNITTKAWCRFTNQNAYVWTNFEDGLFFGGAEGKIYQANSGLTDDGELIPWDIYWAWDYFGDRSRSKKFINARPIITTTAKASSYGLVMDTDFRTKTVQNNIVLASVPGANWGDAWGSAWTPAIVTKDDMYGLSGNGFVGALRMFGQADKIELEINAVQVRFEIGGEN
jgi:hypothetical protein